MAHLRRWSSFDSALTQHWPSIDTALTQHRPSNLFLEVYISLRYERVYLPLCKVADTHFYDQSDNIIFFQPCTTLWMSEGGMSAFCRNSSFLLWISWHSEGQVHKFSGCCVWFVELLATVGLGSMKYLCETQQRVFEKSEETEQIFTRTPWRVGGTLPPVPPGVVRSTSGVALINGRTEFHDALFKLWQYHGRMKWIGL